MSKKQGVVTTSDYKTTGVHCDTSFVERSGVFRLRTKRVMGMAVIVLVCALSLGACAPKTPVERGGDSDSSAVSEAIAVVAWSPEVDCAGCHAAEHASYGDAACAAGKHAGQSCISCHTDTTGLQKAHDDMASDANPGKKLKTTQVYSDTCLSCHGETTIALAESTEGRAVVTDDRGKAVNPHNLPVSDDHASLMCGNCHKMHDSKDMDDQAKLTCLSCHHAGVFECYTCHE